MFPTLEQLEEATTVCVMRETEVRVLNTGRRKNELTLLDPAFFGSLKPRGGADLPPPSKNGGNGWEVPKLSWNLISYQD